MAVTYELLRDALSSGTKPLKTTDDFRAWAEKQEIDWEGLGRLSEEITHIALGDMRDAERTLFEGIAGAFLSGFIASWTFLRQGLAQETFDVIAEGRQVNVRVADIRTVTPDNCPECGAMLKYDSGRMTCPKGHGSFAAQPREFPSG